MSGFEFRQLVHRAAAEGYECELPITLRYIESLLCVSMLTLLICGALARGSEDSRTGPGCNALHFTFLRGLCPLVI